MSVLSDSRSYLGDERDEKAVHDEPRSVLGGDPDLADLLHEGLGGLEGVLARVVGAHDLDKLHNLNAWAGGEGGRARGVEV